jgi:predicted transcriptional regulator
LDIVGNILENLSQGPIGKTRLASKANLDTRASQKYFEMLFRTELIAIDEETKLVKITAKGMEFITELQRIKLFLEGYGL